MVYCSGWSEISGLEPSLLNLRIRAYVLKQHREGGGDAMSIERWVPFPDFPEAKYTYLVNFSPPLTVGNFFLGSTNS